MHLKHKSFTMMYPRFSRSSSSMMILVYSSALFWILDSLLAEALLQMISLTSSLEILPFASLSTMSKKISSLESKLWSEICPQNSSNCTLLIELPHYAPLPGERIKKCSRKLFRLLVHPYNRNLHQKQSSYRQIQYLKALTIIKHSSCANK